MGSRKEAGFRVGLAAIVIISGMGVGFSEIGGTGFNFRGQPPVGFCDCRRADSFGTPPVCYGFMKATPSSHMMCVCPPESCGADAVPLIIPPKFKRSLRLNLIDV